MNPLLKELEKIKVTTPEGRRMKKIVEEYLRRPKTKEEAFEALKKIGIYFEDGTPNPYFFPDKEKKEGK